MKNHPHPGELLREDVLVPLGIEVMTRHSALELPGLRSLGSSTGRLALVLIWRSGWNVLASATPGFG